MWAHNQAYAYNVYVVGLSINLGVLMLFKYNLVYYWMSSRNLVYCEGLGEQFDNNNA